MQFKNIKKDTSKKETPNELKDSLKKEEIREIVEETVEEVLKEQSESTKNIREESHEESHLDTDSNSHEEKEQEDKKESTPVVISDTPFGEKEKKEEEASAEETESSEESEKDTSEDLPKEKSDEESGEKEEPLITPETPVTPIVGVTPVLVTGAAPESQESSFDDTPKKSSMVRLFIIFMLLGIAVGGAIWYATFHNILALKLPPIPGIYSPVTPTKAPSLTLSPTPQQVNVSVAKYDVSILNGSGVAGAASKAKATLADAGFTVTNTGNASTSNFTQTVIAAKSSVDSVTLAKLNQVLGKNYSVSSDILSLNDSQTADIVITLGSSTK